MTIRVFNPALTSLGGIPDTEEVSDNQLVRDVVEAHAPQPAGFKVTVLNCPKCQAHIELAKCQPATVLTWFHKHRGCSTE